MSVELNVDKRTVGIKRVFVAMLIVCLIVIAGIVWIQIAQINAPLGSRIMNWLWRAFVAWKDYSCHFCFLWP